MDESLPTDYDVIVVGTGMTESIIAAAASRIGKTVLHLDSNDYYGGLWASFNFDAIQKWLEDQTNSIPEAGGSGDARFQENGERFLPVGQTNHLISNVKEEWHIPDEIEDLSSVLEAAVSISIDQVNSEKAEDSGHESDAKAEDSDADKSTMHQTHTAGAENALKAAEATEESVVGQTLELGGTGDSAMQSAQMAEGIEAGENIPQPTAPGESAGEEGTSSDANEGDVKGDCSAQPSRQEKIHEKVWTKEGIRKEYRKFNLELAPKLLYSRGSLVELLISSNIARYAEFRCVTRVLTWLDDRLEPVPCSRADVFSTRHVSVVEKRMLMKLLTVCMDYEQHSHEYEGFENKTFLEFLKSRKLTDNLIHFVLYAISLSDDTTPCLEGLNRTQQFLRSLGRYGNTPFLWPMYGAGELPQCFCRLCAVFGGIYYLKRPVESVIFSQEGKCCGLISMGQRLNATFLVMDMCHAPQPLLPSLSGCNGISRGILVTDRSVLPAEKENLTLLQYPPSKDHPDAVTVIEVGASAMACPKDVYVVHLTCKQSTNAEDDLSHVVKNLFETTEEDVVATEETALQNSKPRILWSLYFNYLDTSSLNLQQKCPDNLFFCSGPDLDLDFEVAVTQAKEIFHQMYADSDFLPRAPDPEEIVLDDPENDNPGPEFGKDAQPSGSGDAGQETAKEDEGKDKESPKEESETVKGEQKEESETVKGEH